MSLTAEQREKLLRVLDQTGAKRSPDLKTSAVPKDYAAYMEKVERSEVTLECPAVGVPVVCYIHKAKNRKKDCPVHINIHGGGFIFPHDINDDMYCAHIADGIEGIVVDVEYVTTRTHPFPAAFEQCYEVAKWTFSQCPGWHADAKRVSIGGASAGGCLSADVCMRAAERKDLGGEFCMQVLNYAALDNLAAVENRQNERYYVFSMLYADGDVETLKNPYASPGFAPDDMLKGQPTTVIIAANYCTFKQISLQYGMRLAAMGTEVRMRCFMNSHHGFTVRLADEWWEAQQYVIDNLRSV